MGNSNLNTAKRVKNDEFYTQISDIEKELYHYRDQFKNKTILCNCDDPEWSNFWKYFELNFEFLGLKKLISTHFERDKPSYKMVIEKDINGDGKIDGKDLVKIPLNQNGDFHSPEAIELLKEADIVITNPPFSLFREYIDILMEYDKRFLVIGNMNAITFEEIMPYILANELWLGKTAPKQFKQPDGSMKKFGNIVWYTNLEREKRYEVFKGHKEYSLKDYPFIDNTPIIFVDKTVNIPINFIGLMAVPISYLTKHNPKQFTIMGKVDGSKVTQYNLAKSSINNGVAKYKRLVIKWKHAQWILNQKK